MIIKSHIRGGYRAAAEYLKDVGKNETTRLVEISDPDASNLDEAFRNMWIVASHSRVKKALHHISINPFKDERLSDEQVLKIVECAERKYGYTHGEHQRVIVEHVLNGRQHFHVIWNRVSLATGKAVWPGEHWKKSKQICREMEQELGLKRPVPRRAKRMLRFASRRAHRAPGRYENLFKPIKMLRPSTLNGSAKIVRKAKAEVERPTIPILPVSSTKGWPEAAVIAWESWGKHDPVRFYLLWSELAAPGFSPSG